MKFIKPTTINDARLTSSNVAETDYTAWNAATAYLVGDRCIRTTTHRIYQRQVAGTTATAPELDTTNWLDVGPTNRWAMFDGSVGTQTTRTSPLTVTIAPGVVDSLAVLNVTGATQIAVTMTSGGSTVYSATVAMSDTAVLADWWDYNFADIEPRSDVVLTDLPPFSDGAITITISGAGTVGCGVLVAGHLITLGNTLQGAGIGIIDYSRKETDAFGVTSVTERAFAKRIEAKVLVPRGRVDYGAKQLSAVRTTPVVWIGAGSTYESLIAYGFYKEWATNIAYASYSEQSLTIEALT